MTGDPYQPVIPGTSRQAPSARTFNGLLKSGQAYSRSKFGDLATGAGGAAVDPQTECLVQNKTGVDLAAFSVLVQGAAIIDPATLPFDAQAQKVFEAAAVVDATLPFVITEGPVAADGFIEAVVSGLALVSVVITDATHTRAAPVAGVTDHLVSAASGGLVLWWTPGGTGTKTCLVMVGSQSDGPDATPTVRGWVSAGAQSLAGNKTFNGTAGALVSVALNANPLAARASLSIGDLSFYDGAGNFEGGPAGETYFTAGDFFISAPSAIGTPFPTIFLSAGGFTVAGQTVNVTIGGTTLHFTGGILTSVS